MNLKKLSVLILLLTSLSTFSQSGPASNPSPLSAMVQNNSAGTSTWNTTALTPNVAVIIARGTVSWTNNAHSVVLPNYTGPRADGTPDRLMYIDGTTGEVKISGSFPFDARYLQNFTESDPTVPPFSKSLTSFGVIKSSTDLLYEPVFSKNTAFNLNFGTTVATVAQGNDSRILNGQTAFGWGNHASAGYMVSSNFNSFFDSRLALKNTDNLTEGATNLYFSNSRALNATSTAYKPISYAPNSAEIITGLGYTPVTNSRTITINGTSQDLSSNRTWSVGDLLSSGSYSNPSWITSLAWGKITGTPNIPIPDYTNSGVVAGGAGNVVFYITSDKTSTGTALYTNINYVAPIVNDSNVNYTYGWSYNPTTKALTVNVKSATGINVAVLGLTLLGLPTNSPNGTSVQVLVKGT